MKLKHLILNLIIFPFILIVSQNIDSSDVFKKNKLLLSFIYNQPFFASYETVYIPDNNDLPLIDSIKSKMYFYSDHGFRINHSLNLFQHKSFYHFFRINFYFHRQYIEFKDTVYMKHFPLVGGPLLIKFPYKHFIDMLNLVLLPEYIFRFKLNSKFGIQAGAGYNFSYTMYYNYELYKLIHPYLINKNYFINNYQLNLSTVIKITKKNLMEIGLYWNTNPLWNKYLGFMAGVNF